MCDGGGVDIKLSAYRYILASNYYGNASNVAIVELIGKFLLSS
jgi:hypothetical protein